jgi:hypothetical protein
MITTLYFCPGSALSLSKTDEANSMKFLVITTPRENQQGMTRTMLQATLERVRSRMKAGLLDCLYTFTDGSGAVGVSNAESNEAMMDALDYPISPFVHFQVLPIAGFDNVIKDLIETMEKKGVVTVMQRGKTCNSGTL